MKKEVTAKPPLPMESGRSSQKSLPPQQPDGEHKDQQEEIPSKPPLRERKLSGAAPSSAIEENYEIELENASKDIKEIFTLENTLRK